MAFPPSFSSIMHECWHEDPRADAYYSIAPDGMYEIVTRTMLSEAAIQGICLVPKWFYDTYEIGTRI